MFEPKKRRALYGIGLVVLFVLCFNYSYLLINIIIGWHTNYALRFEVSRILIWLFLGGLFIYSKKIERVPFLLWKEESYTWAFYVLSIVLLATINHFAAVLLATITYRLGFNNLSYITRLMHALPPIIKFIAALTAGITEELMMRGYLIPRLQIFHEKRVMPIIISALLFAAAHLGYGTLLYFLYTFFFGLMAGYFYTRYRNIKILIIFHFLLDFCLLMFIKR